MPFLTGAIRPLWNIFFITEWIALKLQMFVVPNTSPSVLHSFWEGWIYGFFMREVFLFFLIKKKFVFVFVLNVLLLKFDFYGL
jgi:hypothetical protein